MKNTLGNRLNQRIQEALINLTDGGEFAEQVEQLLKILGYTSERKPLKGTGNIRKIVEQKTDTTKADKLLIDESLMAEVIFQITDEEVQKEQQGSFLEEGESFDGGNSKSFIFSFAELKGDNYNRTDLANMTRAVNRVYAGTPSVVLFKYAGKLSVGLIGRRLHKRRRERDVLLKVSLIKDIDLKNPHRAHIDILTELSLAHRLMWMESERMSKDFDGLLKSWLTTLDIKELNKRFYCELSDWFKRAKSETRFPAEKKQEEHIMRLLVRILFVWFIKEKGLVADQLFNSTHVKGLLKEFNTQKSDSYYRAILQNLFFATLNTEIEKRGFSSGKRKTHRNFNLYRYEDQMENPDELKALFEKTPFINGGLFDCLDDFEAKGSGGRRIDCFSDKDWGLVSVPDRLFFAQANSNNKSKGLIELLKSYKFTVEENTPIEQDVALDPELLGQVFEELLDEIDSDEEDENQSHRKDTGSFYTPREVVDYMVNEALIAKFASLGIEEDRLDYLLDYASDYDDAGAFFGATEKRKLVNAIARLRILDPAVGSGAFPMGVLNKLNLALHRLDPENEAWRAIQIDLATEKSRKIFEGETDEVAREDQLTAINHNFQNHHKSGFGRKLYLIQNGIFGVDIQPIACQIARLRFFISLAIEQTSNDDPNDNYGIQPLPNLETRFVVADTLIAQKMLEPIWIQLGKADKTPVKLEKIIEIQRKLGINRERYFNVNTRQTKLSIRTENQELRNQLGSELKTLEGVDHETARQVSSWDPYDQNAEASWFDPMYMFGIQDGFDIVIGNPPYIQLQKNSGKLANCYKHEGYESFTRTGDIYVLFYERGHQLLASDGYLCYITSHIWLRADYGQKLRIYLACKAQPLKLVDFRTKVFEAGVSVNILLLGKHQVDSLKSDTLVIDDLNKLGTSLKPISIGLPNTGVRWLILTDAELRLKSKVEGIGTPLKEWEVKINRGIVTGFDKAFIIDEEVRHTMLDLCKNESERLRTETMIKPLLRGGDIKYYRVSWEGQYLIVVPAGWTELSRGAQTPQAFLESNYPQIYAHIKSFENTPGKGRGLYKRTDQGDHWWELRPCRYYDEFEKKKILWPEITFDIVGRGFHYDQQNFYPLKTAFMMAGERIRYLCGVLNSDMGKYLIGQYYAGLAASEDQKDNYSLGKTYVERLPVPLVTDTNVHRVNEIENLVDSITESKKKDLRANTNKWEKRINELAYQLYELDKAEIKTIEKTVKSWRKR